MDEYVICKIKIKHENDKITFIFNRKEIIGAEGIIYNKWENIINKERVNVTTTINRTKLKLNPYEMKLASLQTNTHVVTINSDDYDLRKEKGIICYYNLNDVYEDEELNNLLKNSNTL